MQTKYILGSLLAVATALVPASAATFLLQDKSGDSSQIYETKTRPPTATLTKPGIKLFATTHTTDQQLTTAPPGPGGFIVLGLGVIGLIAGIAGRKRFRS